MYSWEVSTSVNCWWSNVQCHNENLMQSTIHTCARGEKTRYLPEYSYHPLWYKRDFFYSLYIFSNWITVDTWQRRGRKKLSVSVRNCIGNLRTLYSFFDRHGVSVRALKQQPVCTIILDISVVLGVIHKPCSHFLGDFGPPLPPNVDTFIPIT